MIRFLNRMLFFIIVLIFPIILTNGSTTDKGIFVQDQTVPNNKGKKMKIRVGTYTFIAILYDNAAAKKLEKMLPLSMEMQELNGNEKYAELPVKLPTEVKSPGKIQAGDIMLYGSSTLVIFYKSFPTTYNYTFLGRIDDVKGLAEALGTGKASVVINY